MNKEIAFQIYKWAQSHIPLEIIAKYALDRWPERYRTIGDPYPTMAGRELLRTAIRIVKEEEDKVSDIHKTLEERGSRYGEFNTHAELTQKLKRVMTEHPKYSALSDSQREALDMIAHKIGRIINGDCNYDDSWRDIVGYAQLVLDELSCKP